MTADGPAPLSMGPDATAALGGGLVGRIKGVKLSADARSGALDAEYQALQFGGTGQPVPWSADGATGVVVPSQVYRVGTQDCRGYSQTVKDGERSLRELGTACKSGDKLWTPVL